MSVTNPDKVVTKQDLADFYQDIYPYLGGMPEMVANKFSRSDIYSTTEKIVGQWTDGKPIYQKVFTGTIANTSTRGTETTTSVSVGASVDVFVKTECYSINNNKYSIVPFYRTSSGTGGYIRCISYNNAVTASPNTVAIANAETTSGTVTYILIVQYTKTTDSATSIGVDTDYSTTEKIVGTWIDGSTLYQKTINFGALPNNTTKTVAHSISGTFTVVEIEAIAVNGTTQTSCAQYYDGTNYCFINRSGTNIQAKTNSNFSSYSAYVTIKYVKKQL